MFWKSYLEGLTKEESAMAQATAEREGTTRTQTAQGCAEELANLYSYGSLDCIVELTEIVYADMVANGEQYRRKELEQVLTKLEQFQRLGSAPDWPNKSQRMMIYSGELGPREVTVAKLSSEAEKTAGSREFPNKAKALRDAAYEFFKEPQVAPGDRNIAPIRSAVTALRVFLSRRCGSGLSRNVRNLRSIFDAARGILTDDAIAAVFNAQPIDSQEKETWPIGGPTATDITQFVSRMLKDRLAPDTVSMLQERFTNLQQVAQYGSLTIKAVMELGQKDDWDSNQNKTQAKFYKLIENANEWGNALQRYHSA